MFEGSCFDLLFAIFEDFSHIRLEEKQVRRVLITHADNINKSSDLSDNKVHSITIFTPPNYADTCSICCSIRVILAAHG